jgi:Putative type VII ESX secretion system translocon, EccE
MPTSERVGPPTVRFGRRQSRGLLLGLSAIRVTSTAAALVALIAGLVVGGGIGLVASGLLWGPLLAVTFVRWQGRPVVDWAPVVAHWSARAVFGQTTYRARVSKPRPAGTMALPGDAAPMRFYTDPETGVCMIHDPHRQTLSAVLCVTHPSYVLLSPDAQSSRVGAWGRVLAGLAQSGSCAAIQVLECTILDTGQGVSTWWAGHRCGEVPWVTEQYEALLAQSSHGATTHRTTITLSLDMRTAAKAIRDAGRGMTGAASVLRGDRSTLEYSLRAAELHLDHWLSETEIAVMVRHAYDPAVAAGFEAHSPGANLTHTGPTAVDETWAHLRHDSGFSAVLWISEWPRIDVPPHFLHAVVFAPGVRKSLSIVARPLQTSAALRQIRKEKTEMITDSHQKAKIGQLADLSDAQEYDVVARERALISGHADMAFSGFLAVTTASEDELAAAVSQVERAATQAACETRVLYGQQAQAFVVAALPFARSVL